MKEQLKTIREFFLLPMPHSLQDTLEYRLAKVHAAIATAQLEAMVGEPLTELQKDAVPLLFALCEAWTYVHAHCTIKSRKDEIKRLLVKHGDFAEFWKEHEATQQPQAEAVPSDVVRERELRCVIADLTDECKSLRALLEKLVDVEGPQPGTAQWADEVRAAIAQKGVIK